MNQIEKFLTEKGRKPISWGEPLERGVRPGATYMDWLGGGEAVAKLSHDVVMAPYAYTYFDYYQADSHFEPRAFGGYLTLNQTYSFEPIPANLEAKFQKYILGTQGNLWTECIASFNHLEYMMFPRMTALAEVSWSAKEKRNWEDFNRRLQVQLQRFDQIGINYRRLGNDQRLDRSNRPKTAVKIGKWTPAQLTDKSRSTLEWDVTAQVTKLGKYRLDLDFTRGQLGLTVSSVSLLENGVEIQKESYEKFTGSYDSYAAYILTLPVRKAGAKYIVKAEVTSGSGTDSFGDVFWSLLPADKP